MTAPTHWLNRLTPANLATEKAKFFADQSYNPQFTYEDPLTADEVVKLGFPNPKYLQLAQAILDKTFQGRSEKDLLLMGGKLISHDEVTKKFQDFLELHNLEKEFEIVWSPSFISRAAVIDKKIRLRTTASFYEEESLGLMYHEIGTHALREKNYEQQTWYKQKEAFGLSPDYSNTEEGLASLNGLFPVSFKSLHVAAMRYKAVEFAQAHSFAELWEYLGKYIQDPENRWMTTLRQKRGIGDTSQPGGSTKDMCYFEGTVQVWQWLSKRNFDITPLYFGKFAHQDVELVQQLSPNYQPQLPSFFVSSPEKYAEEMQKVGEWNGLNTV